MTEPRITHVPRLIRILAAVLCCATFPLIFVGGLVTTMQAGMAVPDWPNTYGYNLFLYPLSTWWTGPWNLFVEHGHRLLGAGCGFLSLVICIYAFVMPRSAYTKWLRPFSVMVLSAFCIQGALGGMRVLMDARSVALIHGCTGPLVFMVTMIFAECCSKRWLNAASAANANSTKLRIWSTVTALSAYVQLVIGAHLRHTKDWMSNSAYQMITVFHLIFASLIICEVIALFFIARHYQAGPRFTNLTWVLAFLVSLQISLGVLTWVVNYGWPWGTEALKTFMPTGWVPDKITARSFSQTTITTAHVAVGSLILATTGLLSFRSFSLLAVRNAVKRPQLDPASAVKNVSRSSYANLSLHAGGQA